MNQDNSCQIVVIGSAHLDVLAFYKNTESKKIDKQGNVRVGIGGTAFNIAANLSMNRSMDLITALPKQSIATDIIQSISAKNRINLKAENAKNQNSPAFVGEFCDTNMVSAVNHVIVDNDGFCNDLTYDDLSTYSIIVLDCNIKDSVIADIVANKTTSDQKVIMAAVPESKVMRIPKAVNLMKKQHPFYLASMNEEEMMLATNRQYDLAKSNASMANAICQEFGSKYVVITQDNRGHKVLKNSGGQFQLPAPLINDIKSSIGAGDALLAGIIDLIATKGTFENQEKNTKAYQYLNNVLMSESANPLV